MFPFKQVVRPCIFVARVTKIAWPCSVVLDNSMGLQGFMRVCVGIRAKALLLKGCTRMLMRAVLSVSF